MKPFAISFWLLTAFSLPLACVDPVAPTFDATVNVVVVDGTITDLAEPQVVRLSRSRADPFTGRFGDTPLTGAQVEVVVNATQVVVLRETTAGKYEGPAGFRGVVGNRYQLRFTLSDGTGYTSSVETMPAVPPIKMLADQFNPTSIAYDQLDGLTAAHDIFVTTDDPADETNFYRWDWIVWERQDYCRTCVKGVYYEYRNGILVEDCISENSNGSFTFVYDYVCRTKCWEVLFSADLNLFADTFSNGQTITGRRVAQIPFYQQPPALVEMRQSALTRAAYEYYRRLRDQSQRTGGLADTPPAAPIGNIRNVVNDREAVVGYFTASGVSAMRHWLDRQNTFGGAPGLFVFFNKRRPMEEFSPLRGRPPLAVCVQSDTRTPVRPDGWRD